MGSKLVGVCSGVFTPYFLFLNIIKYKNVKNFYIQSGVSASFATEGSKFTMKYNRSGASCAQSGGV